MGTLVLVLVAVCLATIAATALVELREWIGSQRPQPASQVEDPAARAARYRATAQANDAIWAGHH